MSPKSKLILAVTVVVTIWQLPYGQQILYPFALFATYAHEMGHGLAALMLGGRFDHLMIHSDGSGLAVWQGNIGRLGRALVAAGGLLGPSFAGVLLLVLSRSPRRIRWLLSACAVLVVISVLFWVRNPFGIVFLLAVAFIFGLCARCLSEGAAGFLLHMLAVLLCLSWFQDLNYMFSPGASVNGTFMLSDSAAISQALWLPYWFWGGAIAGISFALVAFGMWCSTRDIRSDAR